MSEQKCDTAGGGYWAGVGYGMSLDNLLTSAVTSASGWWFQPIWKIGSFSQVRVKITNLWNHQLGTKFSHPLHIIWLNLPNRISFWMVSRYNAFSGTDQFHLSICRKKYHTLGILAHLLRMVMEPKYLSEKVIILPNHHLTRWLDP